MSSSSGKVRHPLLKALSVYWRTVVIILIPLCLLPLPLVIGTEASRCAYVLLLMASFWMLELLPLAVTSLIPVALFPLLGIMSTGDTSMYYMKGTCMLFIGGLTLAIAVEHSNLHRRIALNAMRLTGTSPRMLMVGFMIPTGLLSMWINNTASAAMMVPILEAVLAELEEPHPSANEKGEVIELDEEEEKSRVARNKKLRAMLAMTICYSANVGGTGTIVGTPSNVILLEYMDVFEGHPLTFSSWLGFAVPSLLMCLVLVWIWLQLYFLGLPDCFKSKKSKSKQALDHNPDAEDEEAAARGEAVRKLIKNKCDELGPVTWHEGSVLVAFCTCIALWFFRSPGFITGWGDALESENMAGDETDIDDATPAILVVIFLFIFPAKPYFLDLFKYKSQGFENLRASPALLDWQTVHTKMPWGVVILLGGGFALAEGSQRTCLSSWLGDQMASLENLDEWVLVLVVCLITGVVTQICSNAASATMLLPVLRDCALEIGMNPLYLMLPPTLVTSFAFMLPVSTGPNAVCFGPSGLTTFQMVRLGVVMNLLCLVVVNVCINTYGYAMFDLGEFPDWAEEEAGNNSTDFCHPGVEDGHSAGRASLFQLD